MDTKKIVTGTLVGGVVLYAVGFILFQNLFAGFYAANSGNILVPVPIASREWMAFTYSP